jgi:hypothetical protein
MARGEDSTAGRDEVPDGPRIEIGGVRGRILVCAVTILESTAAERRLALSVGNGEIVVRLRARGEWLFTYGDLEIAAPDRTRGAVFVDAVSSWLGTPLTRTGSVQPEEPQRPIAGSYVKLGTRNDADGVVWDTFKLFVGGENEYAECFLRVTSDLTRATLAEKWSRYREPWLLNLDRSLGAGRKVAPRKVVDVLGGAQLTVPTDWLLSFQEGHVRVTDAMDEALLEVSHQPFPLDPRLPTVPERLRLALAADGRERAATSTTSIDRDDIELAWTEYEYEADDTKTGEKCAARARWLVAANQALQVLATYYYWPKDKAWAVPEWETIVSTLRLGSGRPSLSADVRVGKVSDNSGDR